jgi:hypothetical protein
MSKATQALVETLKAAKAKSGGNYQAFRQLAIDHLDAFTPETLDADDNLAQQLQIVLYPDVDDTDWVIAQASAAATITLSAATA